VEIHNPKTGVTIDSDALREGTIRGIASIIRRDWTNPYFGAVPYLQAMSALDSIDDQYIAEDGHTIVVYFLGNANTWRGPIAKAVKAELKRRCKYSR
jgi:hypothetical protein